jgi:hypothetical protein
MPYKDPNDPRRYEKNKAWAEANKEKVRLYKQAYVEKNKDIVRARFLEWEKENPEKMKAFKKQWEVKNPGKLNAKTRKYQTSKIFRTPKWLTEQDFKVISGFYSIAAMLTRENNEPWHVDHIIPLRGKLVSGLHTPNNLQVMRGVENCKKGNKI